MLYRQINHWKIPSWCLPGDCHSSCHTAAESALGSDTYFDGRTIMYQRHFGLSAIIILRTNRTVTGHCILHKYPVFMCPLFHLHHSNLANENLQWLILVDYTAVGRSCHRNVKPPDTYGWLLRHPIGPFGQTQIWPLWSGRQFDIRRAGPARASFSI